MIDKQQHWLFTVAYAPETTDADRLMAQKIRAALIAFHSDEWRMHGKRPQLPKLSREWLRRKDCEQAKRIYELASEEQLFPVSGEYSVKGAA